MNAIDLVQRWRRFMIASEFYQARRGKRLEQIYLRGSLVATFVINLFFFLVSFADIAFILNWGFRFAVVPFCGMVTLLSGAALVWAERRSREP